MYKVKVFFTDLQDFGHPYNVGDVFPREGMVVSDARLAELSSANNKRGKPLIELDAVEDNRTATEPIEQAYTKTEIARMSKSNLQDLATKVGIGGAATMSGAALKDALVAHFGL